MRETTNGLPARWSRRAPCLQWSAVAVTFLLSLVTACGAPAPDESPDEELRPVPELLNRVTNAYPAWSPNGRSIAYMSTADGDFDVYVVHPEAGVRRQLTRLAVLRGVGDQGGRCAMSRPGA